MRRMELAVEELFFHVPTHGGMALAMSMGRPGLGWVAILSNEAIAITTGPRACW